mmetsp:Transcript_20625/g.45163  ORF Transcript_20625/g.45163 Transcript_20625/m.45163 type:complete len:201 (-) Transcript_20625:848-1450(-)
MGIGITAGVILCILLCTGWWCRRRGICCSGGSKHDVEAAARKRKRRRKKDRSERHRSRQYESSSSDSDSVDGGRRRKSRNRSNSSSKPVDPAKPDPQAKRMLPQGATLSECYDNPLWQAAQMQPPWPQQQGFTAPPHGMNAFWLANQPHAQTIHGSMPFMPSTLGTFMQQSRRHGQREPPQTPMSHHSVNRHKSTGSRGV